MSPNPIDARRSTKKKDPRLALLGATFTPIPPPPLFDPFVLPSPAEFKEIAELRAWVARLVSRFGFGEQVPPCWESHWAIATELAGVWTTWQRMADEGDSASLLAWLERLASAIDRIERYDQAGCAARGEHSVIPGPSWAQTTDTDATHDQGEQT